MPWETKWVVPEVFLEYKGVTIYHVYRDNEMGHPLTLSYTTDPNYFETFSDEGDRYRFDVRDLEFPEPTEAQKVVHSLTPTTEREQIADTIRQAIDAGILRAPQAET